MSTGQERKGRRGVRAGIWTPSAPAFVRERRAKAQLQASDWGYAAGWRVVRSMPEFVARNAFDAGAYYAARDGGPKQLRKNLARVIGVTPDQVPDSLMRASLASYGRYWREAFRLPSMDQAALWQQIKFAVKNFDRIEAALAEGRGAVAALPHSGNWDMAGVWLVNHLGTFTTVAERLEPESLYRRFIEFRENLGFEVLPLTGGKPPFDLLVERLRQNKVVCLMADRDLTRNGVPVEFFGEPTRFPAGPARLALETGAGLFSGHGWFDGPDFAFNVDPEIDVSSGDVGQITQTLADRFAVNIAAHPADWHMMQPLWLADLPAERRAKLQGR